MLVRERFKRWRLKLQQLHFLPQHCLNSTVVREHNFKTLSSHLLLGLLRQARATVNESKAQQAYRL